MGIASAARILLAGIFAVLSGIASAADYSSYRVIDTQVLDLMAGPANTAVLLSPDGSQALHIASDICVMAPAGSGTWSKVRCIKNNPAYELRAPEDALWSPRGDRLVMPTNVEGLLTFRDPDIRVFDPQAMTVTNLTDDGNDGSLIKNPKPANFDFSARWLNNDTIAFLRYPINKEGSGEPPSVMTIGAAGGEPSTLAAIPDAGKLFVYAMAVSHDGRWLAYSLDDRTDSSVAGIYLLEAGSTGRKRVAAMSDLGKPPLGMAFSEDGKFLLLLGPNEKNMGQDARVLDLATGKVVPVDANRNVTGVAWSPTGSALAYVTIDREKADEPGGLFLANGPGEPGRQLLKGALIPPVCCGNLPFTWATNDTLILGNSDNLKTTLFVRVGN